MMVGLPSKRKCKKDRDFMVSKKSRREMMPFSDSNLLNTVSLTLYLTICIEPAAVQALARKLEQSVRQIEYEVSLLSEQVNQ